MSYILRAKRLIDITDINDGKRLYNHDVYEFTDKIWLQVDNKSIVGPDVTRRKE